MKLVGMSQLQVDAIQGIFPGPTDSDQYVTTTKSTVTFSDSLGGPADILREVVIAMGKMSDRRHHPYASLHAVVRKLEKLATEGQPTGPTQSMIEEATDQLIAELEANADAIADILDQEIVSPIQAKINAEIATAKEELKRVEQGMAPAQLAYEQEHDVEHAIDFDTPLPKKIQLATDRASARIHHLYERRMTLRKKIDLLSRPEELERRSTVNERIQEVRKMAAVKNPKQTAREMGVPDVYLSESGNFRPGMDARYKSDLVNAALGVESKSALQPFDAADAESRLQARNWTGFLTRKREIIESKAAAAAKKAEAKAQEKAATPEKATAKKVAKADDVEVTPDAKPASAPKRRGGRVRSAKA